MSRDKDAKHGIRGIDNGFILWAEESPDQRQPRSALAIVGDADGEIGRWFRGGADDGGADVPPKNSTRENWSSLVI